MKYPIVLVLLLTITNVSFCQLTVTARAGINISHMQRPKPEGVAVRQDNQVVHIGYHAGASVALPVSKNLSIQTGLFYSLKGLRDTTHLSSWSLGGPAYYKGYGYNFHYLELPVLIKAKLSDYIHLGVGPSLSYLVQVDEFLDEKKIGKRDLQLSKMDYGIVGELSYTKKRFEMGARYSYSLSSVRYERIGSNDPEFYNPYVEESIGKNRSVQFYVGYALIK
ncbi:porin family protein [Flavisolibacter tropicus]|uniref:Outer membrane protein beta-barrel domain-containing protein n=1 Tax=Flavisolibacter tropicus TaxID=1492898 RepID=A0A172TWP7_9BACT|nr:porin family protein [Flavisolibacter tropicus]ANE51304.1 hypothetical protein SY85_13070 [Flavisolibacter tropicus]